MFVFRVCFSVGHKEYGMGMDLKPINPSVRYPREQEDTKWCRKGDLVWGRFNWSGWIKLYEILKEMGMDASFLPGSNDGDKISEAHCKQIAERLTAYVRKESTPVEVRTWIESKIVFFEESGGFRCF